MGVWSTDSQQGDQLRFCCDFRYLNSVTVKDAYPILRMDKETYDSLPLTRWLDKSGKPIEDHPELPEEPQKKTFLKKNRGMPIEIMLKSKIVRETLKAKGYDLNQVETGDTQVDEDLWRLLEKLADDKPVNVGKGREEPEVTILRRSETVGNADSLRGHWLTKSLTTYLSGQDRVRLRVGAVSMETDAVWPLQRHSHISTVDGTCADSCDKDVRQSGNVLCG